MNEYINKKLGELPIHKFLQHLSLIDFLWNFDANSLYPSAMSDPQSIYPRIERGYAYAPDMNDELVKKFNKQKFSQGCIILKINYFSPKNLIVQHIPIKERVKKNYKLIACVMAILWILSLLLIFKKLLKLLVK